MVTFYVFFFRGLRLQKIRRLLLVAERYVASIERAYPHTRKILPHAASFHGYPVKIKVVKNAAKNDEVSKKEDFVVDTHTNESIGAVKVRILGIIYFCSIYVSE